MLEATGERLLPEQQRGELVHAEHLARYRLAAQLAHGKRVLDAASGEGYGTAMLAAAGAQSAVGVDVDEPTMVRARERYGLEFVQGDVAALPFEDQSFDLIVSFETIEHVEQQERVIGELRRVLRADGHLIISTPNRDEYLMTSGFHTREFAPAQFLELLARHFEPALVLYQQNWLMSAILGEEQLPLDDGETPLALELTKVAARGAGTELYTIAICGPQLERPLRDVGVATGVYEAHQLAERLEEAERHVKAWVERAAEAERLVTAWNERTTEAERQLTQKTEKIEAIESSLSWRITKPLRSAKQGIRGERG
jgi:SAM-dependent methyltransferase